MGKFGVQNPISAGQYLATYNATPVDNTDWNSLSSNDFYDSASGAGDSVANTGGVIPIFSAFDVDSQALTDSNVTSIAYKKAASGDNLILYCGFNR